MYCGRPFYHEHVAGRVFGDTKKLHDVGVLESIKHGNLGLEVGRGTARDAVYDPLRGDHGPQVGSLED